MAFRPLSLPLPDPYLLALAATAGLASLLPARGPAAGTLDLAVQASIAALFFLYGVRLAPQAVRAGLVHWRLQALILAITFVLFPLVSLALATTFRSWLPHDLALGLMFIGMLPSTVQASIAFTALARGNVPAALCSATLSNLAGMVVTPALVALLVSARGPGIGFAGLRDIALQLLLPFLAGQLARPWCGGLVSRHMSAVTAVDRGAILLIVYSAFSHGMTAGIWQTVDLASLGRIAALATLMLASVLVASTCISRGLGFSRQDEIAIVFCGSKKSMASGISLANILFVGQPVSLIVLPLMLFHQAQLFACATLARRYAARADAGP
ncbi:bile acid:sodium symporter family protein [Phreatobacter sp. AB_2022a]|uniref:bile acid:sodium symporter family protein n=1 Tax=Phreatobacter sp. AB_2022a TaxID=3003134 RepID=UPI002286ED12|nr:bile acid:sodium symporter family protein [Phreatobacter sp. AB_2022a]MCZ0736383.1 bile acid:sodium symporter [Phreatobacter sp. AB_2022a]